VRSFYQIIFFCQAPTPNLNRAEGSKEDRM
jgi:hypothetical protein